MFMADQDFQRDRGEDQYRSVYYGGDSEASHGFEREAIDANFEVHFPVLDWLFGTFNIPADGHWPSGYGIGGHPVPKDFLRQFFFPFLPEKAAAPPGTPEPGA
jgi:hypothetical protein